MFYQVIILCWAVSAVLTAPTDVVPLEKQQPTVIPIISQSEELEPNGTYKFSYETGNGIKREEISFDKVIPKAQGRSDVSTEGGGSDESDEIHVQQGSYSYTGPDGTVYTVRYIADENGFQAFGDHLPRAPAPLKIASSLPDKSGRALKSADSAEIASAPIPAVKTEPIPKSVESSPEVSEAVIEDAKSAPNNQPPSSEIPSSPADASESSSGVESRFGDKPALVQTTEQSSSTGVSETITEAVEQSLAASDQAPAAANQAPAAADEASATPNQAPVAPEESTPAVQQTTVIAGESSTAATEESSTKSAEESSTTIAEESSTVGAEGSSTTAAVELSTAATGESSTAAAEDLASNNAVDVQSSTVTDNQSTPAARDSQTSATPVEESLTSANTGEKSEPTEQSASVSESEQSASTEAAFQSEDVASTTVAV